MKEILVYLKPNNFPRYLEQINEIEAEINEVDATKFSHASGERAWDDGDGGEQETATDASDSEEGVDDPASGAEAEDEQPHDDRVPESESNRAQDADTHDSASTEQDTNESHPEQATEPEVEQHDASAAPTSDSPDTPTHSVDVAPDQSASSSTAPPPPEATSEASV